MGHLTEFYLWMSVGGVLGGIFNSLIAPVVFHSVMELPLVLMELLANDTERRALGQRATETMRSQVGATMRTADQLQKLLATPRT